MLAQTSGGRNAGNGLVFVKDGETELSIHTAIYAELSPILWKFPAAICDSDAHPAGGPFASRIANPNQGDRGVLGIRRQLLLSPPIQISRWSHPAPGPAWSKGQPVRGFRLTWVEEGGVTVIKRPRTVGGGGGVLRGIYARFRERVEPWCQLGSMRMARGCVCTAVSPAWII